MKEAEKIINQCEAWSKADQKNRAAAVIMVQASDFKSAYDNFMQGMKGTMADFEIIGITETAIMDVFKAKLAE